MTDGSGRSSQFSLNKFYDPITPSMRKGREGGKKTENGKKVIIMTFIVATNVVASQPPERRPTGTPTTRANKGKPQVFG